MASERALQRQAELQEIVDKIAREDTRTVELAEHAFKTDEEIADLYLSSRQKAIVRSWELPKKLVPYALEASSRRIEAKIRSEQKAAAQTVNVENLTIQLPEKKEPELAAIVIDVESK